MADGTVIPKGIASPWGCHPSASTQFRSYRVQFGIRI
jgi:hypothetical protein